jgi:hypothetical protein
MLLDSEAERERNSQVSSVRKYARDRAVSEEFAVAVYERVLQDLSGRARVRRYLGILAEKHAKEAVLQV